jgi:hypothetical protein
MNKKILVDCVARTTVLADLTSTEQAAYDALQTAAAAQSAIEQQAAADDLTARNAAAALVQSCVGVTWQNLAVAQKQALIVALLYKAGALDKSLTVQPLATWLTR